MNLDTVPHNHSFTDAEKRFMSWVNIHYKKEPDIVREAEDILRGKKRTFQYTTFVQENHIRQSANNHGITLPR